MNIENIISITKLLSLTYKRIPMTWYTTLKKNPQLKDQIFTALNSPEAIADLQEYFRKYTQEAVMQYDSIRYVSTSSRMKEYWAQVHAGEKQAPRIGKRKQERLESQESTTTL